MPFADLGLSDQLLRAVTDSGYDVPTPIQKGAIPSVLMGKDLVGIAQTGTGKTASFVLPMIDILAEGRSRARMPRSLILEPTRELAAQVAENFEKYGKYHKLSMALLIGGVQMGDQVKALEKGVDVLIATPGRLKDLFERGKILMTDCSLLVIDEADRMLDMGFIPDIEEICSKLPKRRQTLLFSATMPPPIKKLADKFLTDPKQIEVARPATANINIEQRLVMTRGDKKREALRSILRAEEFKNAIIFCNKKTTVRELYTSLKRSGFAVGQIQGDMDQSNRIAEFDRFKNDEITVLVASDVAARGLDVKGVSHVINFDVPWQPDDYIHRIGRTGRAGMKGIAITLATREDSEQVAAIERLTGMKLPRVDAEAKTDADEAPQDGAREERPSRGRRPRGKREDQA
ncbi:MAG TPA: DEAD/DEAH box helicase, partial [Pseudolabrys sp.]|nr:DEAD/DEAH box helicase [Pseudolabrys sp.]